MKPGPQHTKVRQVNGAGPVDVVVLFKDSDGDFWYQVPVAVDDDATNDLYGEYNDEDKALEAGLQHLANIEGLSLTKYKERMRA